MLWSDVVRVLVALLIGGAIGAEREYRNKAAGLRTMALIGMGSAVFTILSLRLGGSASTDRIASNIVTGIGFGGWPRARAGRARRLPTPSRSDRPASSTACL